MSPRQASGHCNFYFTIQIRNVRQWIISAMNHMQQHYYFVQPQASTKLLCSTTGVAITWSTSISDDKKWLNFYAKRQNVSSLVQKYILIELFSCLTCKTKQINKILYYQWYRLNWFKVFHFSYLRMKAKTNCMTTSSIHSLVSHEFINYFKILILTLNT